MSKKKVLEEILRLSNLDYCACSKDMQYNLEKIQGLIKKHFPKLKESEEK